MAVFTEVSAADAAALAERLALGPVTGLQPIAAGIENTNYFLSTERGDWVLTLFERLSAEQLPFYLELMRHLAQRGIPVPEPRADGHGRILHTLCGKPAAVVDRLRGRHQLAPDLHHCQQVGAMLARMHLAGQDFPLVQPNLRGLPWWRETVPQVLPFVTDAQRALLTDELAFQASLAASPAYAALPRGPVHADLFRDNVMFDGGPDAAAELPAPAPGDAPAVGLTGRERLSGFFDFYFAGVDTWGFDLAVCLNDWCIDLDSGRLDEARATAFVAAYEGVRPLHGDERRLMPALLRAAAFRFWLSRLWDLHLPREASMLKAHDPVHFERVLDARRREPWHPAPVDEADA
ncbi:homoserine kinase [Aquabacterium sp. J223]|uniref:homoserine kinase n=1 Tax=Aquabacterium sp. J223 TaxID=2898431 RepID=UPI0021AD9A3B|nr:homoserine kinase [Aquabacterium sp. J223]UUX95511.1 homoserine kinase [Aquabacterium sp. J223]